MPLLRPEVSEHNADYPESAPLDAVYSEPSRRLWGSDLQA